MTTTLLNASMATSVSSARLGYLLGLLDSMNSLAGVIAPLGAGPAFEHVGMSAPAVISGCIALLGTALTVSLSSTLPRAAPHKED